jgi:hypothetical protein
MSHLCVSLGGQWQQVEKVWAGMGSEWRPAQWAVCGLSLQVRDYQIDIK